MKKWYEEQGKNSDIIISSRVRLARNLKAYPFSPKLSEEQAKEMVTTVQEKLSGLSDEDGSFLSCCLNGLSESERIALAERYVLSPEIIRKKQETGLIVSKDEAKSIMINEEDHLRIQAFAKGTNIEKAFEMANQMDDAACEQMEYAYHRKYGYLTSCPSNVGTGMRASYMVFLPALCAAGKINFLADEVSKYGITLRGMYGEGTEGTAHIYQVSNQKTLGNSEMEIIENLNHIVKQIIMQERKRRDYVLNHNYNSIEDQVYRSYGVLKYTRQINTKDAMTLLSQVKFGFDTGILKVADEANIDIFKMMIEIQPHNLQAMIGKNPGNEQRERNRAEYINKRLPKILGD